MKIKILILTLLALVSIGSSRRPNFSSRVYGLKMLSVAKDLSFCMYSDQCVKDTMTEIATKDNHDFFIRQNCDRSIRLGIGKVNRQTLVLSFRGTKNLSNVLTDLNFAPIKWDVAQGIRTMEMEDEEANENDIKVHRGFLEAYCSIQAAIQGLFMGNFMNGVETVIFAGHSLGGALASISALDFRRMAGIAGNNNLKYHLITFGSPRVGNQIFANNINGMMDVNMRVVFEDDIVPQVPDKPYVHPGDLVVVKSNDDVVITRRLDEGDSSERYVDIDENEINTKSVLLKSLEAGCIEGAKYITSFFCTLPKDEKPFLKKVTDHSKYKSISAETLESMYNIYANLTPNFNQMKKKLRRRKNRKLLRKR